MATILLTGANGLLGAKLCALLRSSGLLVAAGRGEPRGPCSELPYRELDVADAGSVNRLVDEVRPAVILHAAALTDVDGCEKRRDEAWAVNADGAAHVARAAARHQARLVYLSTEYVFD